MGFLSPWFLAGMAAVGLPLWLHLLRQYKRTPQPFSSLMFFERRVQSSVKHRRLRYLMLLALRLLLLLLLALAFANPFINRPAAASKRRSLTVIAIDRSFSMRYGDRFAQAKAKAHQIINGLPGRDMAQVIAVDSHIENLTQPEIGKSVLNAAVDSVGVSDEASSFGELARALRVLDGSSGMHLDVRLISDMQQTSMPAGFADLQLGSHTALQTVTVGNSSSPNWAIETVTAPVHVYDPSRTRLTATVAGWQTQPASRHVSVVLDGKIIASKDVSVTANGRAQVEFSSFDVPYGNHKGEVRIEPHDNLADDDSFPFSIERSDPRKVLYLYAGGRAGQAFYYKAALESAGETGLTVQAQPAEQAPGTDFSKFAFVVLSDTGALDAKLDRALCDYVGKGGSLLIALGPNSARAGRAPVAGNRLADLSQTQGVGYVDNQDPALIGAGHLENVQFSQAQLISVKPSERILAKLADGSPLLVEQSSGEGRILLFASTLDDSTNDFPLHASFLPFVAQTGRYLAGSQDVNPDVIAGTPVELRRTRNQETAADVIGPGGKHELSLTDSTHALSFDLLRNGFYEVQKADGRRLLMAVHADRRESDLKPIPDETLALWRNTGDTATGAPSGTSEQQTRPFSLWRYVMFLVLLAALVESVFASRYLTEERQTA